MSGASIRKRRPWPGVVAPLLAVALAGCTSIVDFVGDEFFLPVEGVRPAQYGVTTERSVGLTLADGVTLRADIYHPVATRRR